MKNNCFIREDKGKFSKMANAANAVNAVNAANPGEATRFPLFGQMSIFDHG